MAQWTLLVGAAIAGCGATGCTLVAGVETLSLHDAGRDGDSGATPIILLPGPNDGGDAGVDATPLNCIADGDTSNPCYLCTDQSCCAPQAAYAATDAGPAFRSCLDNCAGDVGCQLTCIHDNPTGHDIEAPYEACAEFHCYGPCGGPSDLCDTCLQSYCPQEEYKCFSVPDCDTLNKCITGCNGNVSCNDSCHSNAQGSSIALFNSLLSCTATYCTSSSCATLD